MMNNKNKQINIKNYAIFVETNYKFNNTFNIHNFYLS